MFRELILIMALTLSLNPVVASDLDSTSQEKTFIADRSMNSPQIIGQGDGKIHVIPSLSSPSVKNGEKLSIRALIKAVAGVSKVEARIISNHLQNMEKLSPTHDEVARLLLGPVPLDPGGEVKNTDAGLWQSEWTGNGLTDGYYRVVLRVTDRNGHVFEDNSLKFSDPIAGNNTVGNINYAAGGMGNSGAAKMAGEQVFISAAIDAAGGLAYFGTDTSPGQVVKVALGSGGAAPSLVGTLILENGENRLSSAVIDAAAGYLYFGTGTAPGRVIKVAKGESGAAPTRVGAVTLNSGENYLRSGVIDATAGYAYFGTGTFPGRVIKIALGPGSTAPERVNALSTGGLSSFYCGVIDTAAGYAYFGTFTTHANVAKIALGAGNTTPTLVNSVPLNDGEDYLQSAVIDAAAGYAYFGTRYGPGKIFKIKLGSGDTTPTRVSALTLNSGEDYLQSAVIDTTGGYAYFGTGTLPGQVVKIELGASSATPTRIGAVTLNSGENELRCGVINASSGYAYFGTGTIPGQVVKVDLGSGGAVPSRTNALVLNGGEYNFNAAVIDAAAGYAYLGTYTTPGRVIKVALGDDATEPNRIGEVTLSGGEYLNSAAIDAAAGYAYFGTRTVPGRVIKVALGTGTALPSQTGAVTLNAGEDNLSSAVIDPAAGYVYFGTRTSPGKVVKVAKGADAAAPNRTDAVTLDSGEDNLLSAVIDPGAGYAYFGSTCLTSSTVPGKVVKVALGSGAAAPSRIGAVTLDINENNLASAVIDPADGYAYFGAGNYSVFPAIPSRIVKVKLESGDTSPTRVGAAILNSEEYNPISAAINPAAGFAYFGTDTRPGRVVKIKLENENTSPTRVGALALNNGEDSLRGALIDAANDYVYFDADTVPGQLVKVNLSQQNFIKLTRLVMPETGIVEKFSFYSHQAGGHLRLALYREDSANARTLIWESASTSNTATNAFIDILVSGGTPAQLTLQAGTYYFAWQIDTAQDVPSYTPGATGEGSYIAWNYRPFPGQIKAADGAINWTPTDEEWSGYVTYEVPNGVAKQIWLNLQ